MGHLQVLWDWDTEDKDYARQTKGVSGSLAMGAGLDENRLETLSVVIGMSLVTFSQLM